MNIAARSVLLTLMIAGLCVGFVFAAEPTLVVGKACILFWTANTEPDLAGYRLYLSVDSQPRPTVEITAPATSIPCGQAGIAQEGAWKAELTAYDQAGNESDRSKAVVFIQDLTGPAVPSGVGARIAITTTTTTTITVP
ncbi:hypothetical protein [Candidatus Nitrospira bockiana]